MEIPKQPKLLNFKNLNIEKYEYLLPHKTQNGYYQSICNYRLSKNQILPFYFETPKLKTTSGIVKIDNKFYIDFELSQSGDIGLFNEFIKKNDNNNISVCHENSRDWFKQLMPLNVVENYYKSPIIKQANGQLPIFRVRLPCHKGNILTEIFNVRKEKVYDISCIQEGDQIIGIMEFSGLIFMSQNFTPCYELHKIKLLKDNDTRLLQSGYIFSDMNEKIDLDNNIKNDNIMEDPIVISEKAKPIEQTATAKPTEIDESYLNIKTVNIKQTDKIPKKTLFDMIKETSLKDFIIDDAIFNNNNKLFTRKIKLENIDNDKTVLVNKQPTTEQNPEHTPEHTPEQNKIDNPKLNDSKLNDSKLNDSKIQIQDINNIELDIDYNLESPSSPSSPNSEYNNDIDNDENLFNVDELEDNLEDEEDNLEDEEDNSDNEEDNSNNEEDNLEHNSENEEDNSDNEEDNSNNEEQNSENEEQNSDEDDSETDGINFETLDDLEVIVFDE
jgi:hypothetical protein